MPRIDMWVPTIAALAILMAVSNASSQSAIERHVWQDKRSFQPLSRTAVAITGPISLSGNPEFAQVGSTMNISFGGGPAIELVSEGASWREWQLMENGKETAEVFQVASDPGRLLNGNTGCSDALRYLVFSEGNLFGTGATLEVAAFSGTMAPFDINSDGLCGTYSYAAD